MDAQLKFEFDLLEGATAKDTPEKSEPRRELTLVLELTGNPWTDFGIVSFCEELESAKRAELLEVSLDPTAYQVTITIDPSHVESLEEWLNLMLKERWNRLYWLSRTAKILGRTNPSKDKAGFIDQEKSEIVISDGDREKIKKHWKGQIKDRMPQTQWRFNFIGISGNAQSFREKQSDNVKDFIHNWKYPTGKKVCETSGRPAKQLKKLLQVVNPFANKSQLTKVRGVYGCAVNPEVGPLYYVINLCTTLDADVPFIYDPSKQNTRLILPYIPDLALLAKVYTRLKENVIDDLGQKGLYPYTNLRPRFQTTDRYSLAILLFHNIFYSFTEPEEEEEEGVWDFSPPTEHPEQTVKQLTRWVTIPFTKGQNVIFQNFHTIQVNERLYDFIKPLPFGNGEIALVLDILTCMSSRSPDGQNALGQLSRAIATSTPTLMKVALFNLWKNQDSIMNSLKQGRPHPARLLQSFINHFLEVNRVLDEKLRDDLRVLGKQIGETFYRDVTLISKLYNISSETAFREALNVVMFRLYKISTGEKFKTQKNKNEVFRVKAERIDHILDGLTEGNYKEIAETLSTYVSLSAYNAKFDKPDNGGTENE